MIKLGLINILISGIVAILTYYSLILIANTFGASLGSDGYFFIFSLTTLCSSVVTLIYSVVVIPTFIELRNNQDMTIASEFISSIFVLSIASAMIIALPSYFMYDDFFAFTSKYTHKEIKGLKYIFIYFTPLILATIVNEYLKIILLSYSKFYVVALAATVQPILLIISSITLSKYFHEQALVIALLSSKIIVSIIMLIIICQFKSLKLRFKFINTEHIQTFYRVSAPYWVAGIVTNFSIFYFDYSATALGIGVISSLTYAQKIASSPISLIITPLLEIARVKFANFQSKKDEFNFINTYHKLATVIIYISLGTAFILYSYAYDITNLILGHGSYSKQSIDISTECLKAYSLGIPFGSMFLLNGRAVESFQKLNWPSIFGTVGNILLLVITTYSINTLGYIGIPYAKVTMDLLYFLPFGFISLYLFEKKLNLKFIAIEFTLAIFSTLLTSYISTLLANRLYSSQTITNDHLYILKVFLFVLMFIPISHLMHISFRTKHND